ncbi:MAG: acyl-CoA thioesterase [Acidimicrobiia bacterium]
MFELQDLLDGLALEHAGDNRLRAPNMNYYGKQSMGETTSVISDVVAGGQLLAQAIVAASQAHPDKTVKSMYAVFARSGRVSQDLYINVDTIQSGRTMSTVNIGFEQGGKAVSTATLLMHAPDADAIRYANAMPVVDGPDAVGTIVGQQGPFEVGTIAGTKLASPDDVAPAEYPMWVRFAGLPTGDAVLSQACLAFASNFQHIGVAMRPHKGLDVSRSHLTVSTGVLTHSVSFHEPFEANDWLLLDLDVPYAGSGRIYGRGAVYTRDGQLVANFSQDGMIRPLAAPGQHGATSSL